MEHHPLDDCTLFMPRDKGPEGTYSLLLRGRGWSDCDADQNAFPQANKSAHVPASKLRQTEDDDEHTSWGGMAAFNVFVVGGITREGARLCSNCQLPGHNRRTCTLPKQPELDCP